MRRLLPPAPARLAAATLVPGAALLFHLRLLGSDPAADAVLARPPAAVRLWFSQRAELAVTRVRLVGPNGTAVALGPLARDAAPAKASVQTNVQRTSASAARGQDDGVMAAVRGPMPPGTYAVEWRTMAADGHPVSGRMTFRIAAPAR